MTEKEKNGDTEMDKFLPSNQPDINGTTTYIYQIDKQPKDVEAGVTEFDPFKARVIEHPVTDCGTLTHLLKASLGTGILSMPAAFQASGLIFGIFATIIVSAICTHCAYILVECAHVLYRKSGKTKMSFSDVAEEACLRGPMWARKYAPWAKTIIDWSLFITYFTTCSCYAVIMATNFNYVIFEHMTPFDERITIAMLLIPIVLLAYVPNLKYLAPVSMVANVFMGIGLGITFYYLVQDLPPVTERDYVPSSITTLPTCISIVIFAIEAIGVVMPLENNMQTPQHFVGLCGVLNRGMSGVTMIYIILGFIGYLKYGEDTKGSITLNLPSDAYAAQAVNILIGLAVFCTFGLQFYVCIEIAWNKIKERYSKRERLANYIMRTVMTVVCVLIAIAVPQIIPFVSLIGAFCFSFLGLIFPVLIEIITFWDKGFGPCYWKVFKNFIVIATGVLALIFGSKTAINDILAAYT